MKEKPQLLEITGSRYQLAGFVDNKMGDKMEIRAFPGGAVVGNLPANAGDTGSSPGLGRSHMPRSN